MFNDHRVIISCNTLSNYNDHKKTSFTKSKVDLHTIVHTRLLSKEVLELSATCGDLSAFIIKEFYVTSLVSS